MFESYASKSPLATGNASRSAALGSRRGRHVGRLTRQASGLAPACPPPSSRDPTPASGRQGRRAGSSRTRRSTSTSPAWAPPPPARPGRPRARHHGDSPRPGRARHHAQRRGPGCSARPRPASTPRPMRAPAQDGDRRRPHEALDDLTPAEYETAHDHRHPQPHAARTQPNEPAQDPGCFSPGTPALMVRGHGRCEGFVAGGHARPPWRGARRGRVSSLDVDHGRRLRSVADWDAVLAGRKVRWKSPARPLLRGPCPNQPLPAGSQAGGRPARPAKTCRNPPPSLRFSKLERRNALQQG